MSAAASLSEEQLLTGFRSTYIGLITKRVADGLKRRDSQEEIRTKCLKEISDDRIELGEPDPPIPDEGGDGPEPMSTIIPVTSGIDLIPLILQGGHANGLVGNAVSIQAGPAATLTERHETLIAAAAEVNRGLDLFIETELAGHIQAETRRQRREWRTRIKAGTAVAGFLLVAGALTAVVIFQLFDDDLPAGEQATTATTEAQPSGPETEAGPEPLICDPGQGDERQFWFYNRQNGQTEGDGVTVTGCISATLVQAIEMPDFAGTESQLVFEQCQFEDAEVRVFVEGETTPMHTVRSQDGDCIESKTPWFAADEQGKAGLTLTVVGQGNEAPPQDFSYRVIALNR